MDDLQRLIAIEDIKQLKARYWRGVDTRDRAMLGSVFTRPVKIETEKDGPDGKPAFQTDDVEEFLRHVVDGTTRMQLKTVHQGQLVELKFVTDDEADGIWLLEDRLWAAGDPSLAPFRQMHGWGHYHERYRKTAEGWRIQAMTLIRLRADIT